MCADVPGRRRERRARRAVGCMVRVRKSVVLRLSFGGMCVFAGEIALYF